LNLHFNTKLKNKWSTGLLLHGNYFQKEVDHNHDGFLDLPFKRQANALSRWLYSGDHLHFEFNVQGVLDGRMGGQTAALAQMHGSSQPYVIQTDVRRLEGFGKLGYFGFENPLQSLAMIYSATYHEQNSQIGLRQYQAKQKSLYWNGVFQTDLLRSKAHHTTWGITYQYDDFQEDFTDLSNNRVEQVLGAYGEYEWQKALDKGRALGLILGLRADYVHTPVVQRVYVAPRFNAKYNFSDKTVLRASAGRGVRNVNVLMENLSFMASRRQFILQEAIRPEVAWNYGVNLVHQFRVWGQEGSMNVDLYRTDFENQLVSDPYSNVEQISFYNLKGRSFANSLLLAYTQDLFKGFELRLAYKYNDVQSTYEGKQEWQPFSPRHRGLVAVHYTTPKERWQFNANAQITGQQRLPGVWGDLSSLPDYRQAAMAPSFTLFNAQITHYFPWGLDVYVGAENLGNYRQAQPILGYHDPFGTAGGNSPRFDAASVYGPVMGTMVYAGLRYTLKPKRKGSPGREAQDGHHHHHEEIDEALFTKIEINTSAQCGMCKSSIEDKMYHLPGVGKAKLNLKDKKATIFYDPKATNPDALRKAISEMGYDADEVKGDAKAYEQLPDCCKKP
jgi:copper chaperone CopZ